MKRVVTHTRSCKRKTNGGCPICKQLIALCCYHAKHCNEIKCPVPFCLNIRQKLRQQQIQQRMQTAQLLRRRMAAMSSMGSRNAPAPGTPGSLGSSGLGGPASPLESPQPADGGHLQATAGHHQPGVGMKPTTHTPPANVLQVRLASISFFFCSSNWDVIDPLSKRRRLFTDGCRIVDFRHAVVFPFSVSDDTLMNVSTATCPRRW